MSENQLVWIEWARILQQRGMDKGIASFLEIGGSLNVLFAQLLYIGQPLLSGVVSSNALSAVAQMLENPADRQKFIGILREGAAREPAA